MKKAVAVFIGLFTLTSLACSFGFDPNAAPPSGSVSTGAGSGGDTAAVTRVVDGDTIEVKLNGRDHTVRYVGVNTPERGEVCYSEAVAANKLLVENKTVRLTKDRTEADQYGRLLRYVHVGDTFVNAALVQQGFAEAVLYEPDRARWEDFKRLEAEARAAKRGCHQTNIFNDGSDTR
jgi:micrococcal nuclease